MIERIVASRHILQVIIKQVFQDEKKWQQLLKYTEEMKITGNGKYVGQYKRFYKYVFS